MQRMQWFLEARPCLEVGYDPLNTACSHCSRTVNVNKTWSNSIDAVFRNRNMGAMCLVLCIVSLLAVQRSSRVLLVQVTWDSQNGLQKVGRAIPSTTYCWVSVSKEKGAWIKLFVAGQKGKKTDKFESDGIRFELGRRRSNPGKSEHEMREHPKDGSIRKLWKKKRVGKTETSGNFRM